jgi:hypothetical protein
MYVPRRPWWRDSLSHEPLPRNVTSEQLRYAAQALRDEVDYQLTVTTTRGGAASVAPQALPFGMQVTWGTERARENRPMTLPIVVDRFREFVEKMRIALEVSHIVIAIDEIDKIADVDAAAQFLDGVKVLFGTSGCIFLTSVSLEALTNFQRRGLPAHESLDNSFDDVISVEAMKWESAKDLLARRIIGLPVAFGALCFVLSGGLPRELLRVTRRMIEVSAADGSLTLDSLGRQLMNAEYLDKATSTATALASCDPSPDVEEMSAYVSDLCARLDEGENVRADKSVEFQHGQGQGNASARRLMDYLIAYGFFRSTLMEIFGSSLSPDAIGKAENPDASYSFDRLAAARRSFSLGPAAADVAIRRVRDAWGLASSTARLQYEAPPSRAQPGPTPTGSPTSGTPGFASRPPVADPSFDQS